MAGRKEREGRRESSSTNLGHLHRHLTHSSRELWEFDELVGEFHDFGGFLKGAGDFEHG